MQYAIPNKDKYEQKTMSFERTMDSFKKIIIGRKQYAYLNRGNYNTKETLIPIGMFLINMT